MQKTSEPPTWDPTKGNIFQWILERAVKARESLPPPNPERFSYKLRKV